MRSLQRQRHRPFQRPAAPPASAACRYPAASAARSVAAAHRSPSQLLHHQPAVAMEECRRPPASLHRTHQRGALASWRSWPASDGRSGRTPHASHWPTGWPYAAGRYRADSMWPVRGRPYRGCRGTACVWTMGAARARMRRRGIAGAAASPRSLCEPVVQPNVMVIRADRNAERHSTADGQRLDLAPVRKPRTPACRRSLATSCTAHVAPRTGAPCPPTFAAEPLARCCRMADCDHIRAVRVRPPHVRSRPRWRTSTGTEHSARSQSTSGVRQLHQRTRHCRCDERAAARPSTCARLLHAAGVARVHTTCLNRSRMATELCRDHQPVAGAGNKRTIVRSRQELDSEDVVCVRCRNGSIRSSTTVVPKYNATVVGSAGQQTADGRIADRSYGQWCGAACGTVHAPSGFVPTQCVDAAVMALELGARIQATEKGRVHM